jgi:hypothetical protein
MDYLHSLDPQTIPYNDDNEVQNIQPGDILTHGYKDELSLDYSMYDCHSIDYIPNCRDVDSPMKDMYDVRFICMPHVLISECAAVWETGMAMYTIALESTRDGAR